MEGVGLDLLDQLRFIETSLIQLISRFDDEQLWMRTGPAGALAIHGEAKKLSGLVRDLVNEVDGLLIASMEGQRRAEIDGRVVETRRAYKRTWDTPLLAGAVAACVLGGERLAEVDTVVEAFVRAARLEWRVTALDEMGITPDDYCSKELGRPTVTVIGGAS